MQEQAEIIYPVGIAKDSFIKLLEDIRSYDNTTHEILQKKGPTTQDAPLFLNLPSGMLSEKQKDELSQVFSDTKEVTHIAVNFPSEDVNEQQERSFADILNASKIRQISIGNISQFTERKLLSLINILNHTNTLKTLSLTHCLTVHNAIEVLANFIKNNKSVIEMDLSHCELNNEDALKIAEALKFNHTLELLRLNNNKIGVRGAAAIVSASNQKNSQLKFLFFKENLICFDKVAELVSAIVSNKTLQLIDLSSKYWKINEIEALAWGFADKILLKSFNKIFTLDLSNQQANFSLDHFCKAWTIAYYVQQISGKTPHPNPKYNKNDYDVNHVFWLPSISQQQQDDIMIHENIIDAFTHFRKNSYEFKRRITSYIMNYPEICVEIFKNLMPYYFISEQRLNAHDDKQENEMKDEETASDLSLDNDAKEQYRQSILHLGNTLFELARMALEIYKELPSSEIKLRQTRQFIYHELIHHMLMLPNFISKLKEDLEFKRLIENYDKDLIKNLSAFQDFKIPSEQTNIPNNCSLPDLISQWHVFLQNTIFKRLIEDYYPHIIQNVEACGNSNMDRAASAPENHSVSSTNLAANSIFTPPGINQGSVVESLNPNNKRSHELVQDNHKDERAENTKRSKK